MIYTLFLTINILVYHVISRHNAIPLYSLEAFSEYESFSALQKPEETPPHLFLTNV